jgi:hypothetical protein
MGSKVYFTKKIAESPEKLFKQLNTSNTSRGTSKRVEEVNVKVSQAPPSSTTAPAAPAESSGLTHQQIMSRASMRI